FALAENYLFTKEAFKDYWKALSDSGYMSLEHQFYVPRLVPELIEALTELGIPDPAAHFAVYDLTTLRRNVILLSKRTLTPQLIDQAYANSQPKTLRGMRRLYPPVDSTKGNLIDAIVHAGWKSVADTARVDISPCTDDRPFIAQMGRWKNLSASRLDKIPMLETGGFPLSGIIMIVILSVCLVVIVPINLVPYVMKREKLQALPWLFFFTIGLAYMMIEVILIQQYTLFIGSTVYSLAVVLAVLLGMSGIGSAQVEKYPPSVIFSFIIGWTVADIILFPELVSLCGAWPLGVRLFLSGLLLAPLGYFMGMPFPKAAVRVPGLVDWAFAINGCASVIGSVAVIFLATSFGYAAALTAALTLYGCAYMLFMRGFKNTMDA
ncbi:MAG TPA: hypothetical protein VK470_13175, partial [Bacteroidota bacterium]|nr:hypothetical protein [Bacteroidota bacterium]